MNAIERDTINRQIATSAGWEDVHGGADDGGLYLRGYPPGTKGRGLMTPVPDYLALVNGHTPPAKVCKWKTQPEDYSGVYETGCNQAFEFTSGSPDDNNFLYCPYCGGEIEVAPPPLTEQDILDERGDRAYQELKDMEVEEGPWAR